MPKYWFTHVHIVSPDFVKTAEFYEKMFGATVVDTREVPGGRTAIELDLNGSTIMVTNPRDEPVTYGTPQGGLDHFGLGTDNIEEAVADLKAQGVEFVRGITQARKPGVRLTHFLGPENVLIELMERK